MDDDDRAIDPFLIFSAGGSIFPDEATDDYKQLCLAAVPNKADKIEELFEHEKYPTFSTIDALQEGNSYPKLKSLLQVSSDAEILMGFLHPSDSQLDLLKNDKTWTTELKQFMQSVLGLKPQSKKIESLQKELWRITLFSEFVYDLPIELPNKLKDVPSAQKNAEALIMKTCEQLRNQKNAEEIYVNNANEISSELSLPKLFANEKDLGKINTFAFEDSTFFYQFKEHFLAGKTQDAINIVNHSEKSIWAVYDDERRSTWHISRKVTEIANLVTELKKEFNGIKGLNQIIQWYSDRAYLLDTYHREMEKEVQTTISLSSDLNEVCDFTRKLYAEFMDNVQKKFQASLIEEGFQSISAIKNLDLFDAKIKPLVKEGKKTVFILADALRFELAKELSNRLERANFKCDLQPAFAFTPTITKYGMAALMPGARDNLCLKVNNDKLEPFMIDRPISSRHDRLRYTNEIYGDKAEWYWEKDINDGKFDSDKDLLFITTTEVDKAGENIPDKAQLLIEVAIKQILKVCNELKESGYEEFVLVADHGFVLFDRFKSGNKTSKPVGDWVLEKSRCLAGKGSTDDNHLAFTAEDIGIKSEIDQFLFLKNYATYEKGVKFFHEGLSLQECITPCLSFHPQSKTNQQEVEINLTYKGKDSGSITTRRPSLEISTFGETLFGDPIDVLIEAIKNNEVVGIPAISEHVNATTGYLEVMPGQSMKFTLIMEDDFEGQFIVYAKSPATGIIFSEISLETDYL